MTQVRGLGWVSTGATSMLEQQAKYFVHKLQYADVRTYDECEQRFKGFDKNLQKQIFSKLSVQMMLLNTVAEKNKDLNTRLENLKKFQEAYMKTR